MMKHFRLTLICFLLGSMMMTAAGKVKVACVGNSITYGAGITNPVRDGYPGLLSQMLGEGYDVRNYGVSGRTLLLKGDRPWTNEPEYQAALAFCPDIVTIKLGTNDTKPFNWVYASEFPADLEKLVRSFQALPSHPKVILCYPVPAYRLDWGINDSIIKNGVLPYIDEVAAKTGAEVLDLYTPFTGKPELFVDQIHPNEQGALELARVFYRKLTGRPAPDNFKPQAWPGVKSQWEGYDCYQFSYKERQVRVVVPKQVADGSPWIWRPAFFGAFAQVDKALLEKGWHVVFMDLADEYARPEALKAADALYKYLTQRYGLAKKMTLEGFSRGGMFAINWAAGYGHKVQSLYLDAPVCDVFTWPGAKNAKWAANWQQFLDSWQLDNASVAGFKDNPIDKLEAVAKAGIPIIVVAGKKDKIVPYKQNTARLVKDYRALGGDIEVIVKKKGDHHPHSLDDPTPVVDFLEQHR